MRRLIVRLLGPRLDERVRREIRNTEAMQREAKRAVNQRDFWREQWRAMRDQRDLLLVEVTKARIELADLRARSNPVSAGREDQ